MCGIAHHTAVTDKLTAIQLTKKFCVLWNLKILYYSEEPITAFYKMPDESPSHLLTHLSDAF
jgi:hypothetical protein